MHLPQREPQPAPDGAQCHMLRGRCMMLDIEVANLYGTTPAHLRQIVRDHAARFPEDFMIILGEEEIKDLTAEGWLPPTDNWQGNEPLAFSELGVSMLSHVLDTERAIEVSLARVRAFTALQTHMADYKELQRQIVMFQHNLGQRFPTLQEAMRYLATHGEAPQRQPIGFRQRNRDED